MRINKWKFIKLYTNRKFLKGKHYLRREVKKAMDERIEGMNTIDNYRNYLTKIGVLKMLRRGEYEILQKIPDWMNSENLYNMYVIEITNDRGMKK